MAFLRTGAWLSSGLRSGAWLSSGRGRGFLQVSRQGACVSTSVGAWLSAGLRSGGVACIKSRICGRGLPRDGGAWVSSTSNLSSCLLQDQLLPLLFSNPAGSKGVPLDRSEQATAPNPPAGASLLSPAQAVVGAKPAQPEGSGSTAKSRRESVPGSSGRHAAAARARLRPQLSGDGGSRGRAGRTRREQPGGGGEADAHKPLTDPQRLETSKY